MPRTKKTAATLAAAEAQHLAVPHPDRWFEFAHELDGYAIAEELGVDLSRTCSRLMDEHGATGRWARSLLELRLVLFFLARASRFTAGLTAWPENGTDGPGLLLATGPGEMPGYGDEIVSLLNAIAVEEDEKRGAEDPSGDARLIPDALEVGIGGYFGPSYRIGWENGRIVYEGHEPAEEDGRRETIRLHRFVRPTERRWRGFWKSLDDLSAWDWERHYENPGALDGTGWHLTVERNGVRLESEGSNAYPGGHSASREFRGLLAAVRRLLGGLPFA
ncbi:MAG TPA: hypothetical protein VF168_14570 [Trueperaceae bacterium]